MARLKMAPYTYSEGLGESQLSPLRRAQQGPQVVSKLEMLKSEYQERALREKEQKMLKLLTQQQERISQRINGYRTQPAPKPQREEKAWAANWTVAKRSAGVDRAHPLQPVYPRNETKVHRSPSANVTGIKHSLPYVRSKSGPSRTEQWQELEKSEMSLEAEIRRKEALLREKLRRTEEELRRIQKEKEEAEREERRAQEIHYAKMRPRRPRVEERDGKGGVKAEKGYPLSIDQYSGGNVKAEKGYPLSRDQYSSGNVKAEKGYPLSRDQYSSGNVKAEKGYPLSIDQYSRAGVMAGKDSPHSIDQYSRAGVMAGKDSPHSIDQYSRAGVMAGKDSPHSVGKSHRQYVGARDTARSDIEGAPLTRVIDSFHHLRLEGVQDSRPPSSEHMDEEALLDGNIPQSPGQQLVPCDLCGRRFMEHRLEKHTAVCEKMQSSRRKVFDSSKARAKGTDLEQYLHRKGRASSQAPQQVKSSSWRQKHESFLRTIRQARVVQDVLARGGRISDLPPPIPDENPDYVSCPHCSRRFAPRVAERHIPKCETIKSKPRPPPSRRR